MTQAENTLLARLLEEVTGLRGDLAEIRERLDIQAEVFGHYETSLTSIEDAQECMTQKLDELARAVASMTYLQDLHDRPTEAEAGAPPGTA